MITFLQQRSRLRFWLTIVVIALAVPSGALLIQSFKQLQYESFFSQQNTALAMAGEVQRRFEEWLTAEANRPTTDYDFLVISGASYVQRSPLSSLEPATNVPGVVGFFQVDATGHFATPLLPHEPAEPTDLDLSDSEYTERLRQQTAIRELLQETARSIDSASLDKELGDVNAAVAPAELGNLMDAVEGVDLRRNAEPAAESETDDEAPSLAQVNAELRGAEESTNQLIYNQLSRKDQPAVADNEATKVSELKLKERFVPPEAPQSLAPKQAQLKKVERSRSVSPERQSMASSSEEQVTTFDSSVDPFRMDRLDRDHWVFFRNVWAQEQRFVQGFIVEATAFLDTLVGAGFAASPLAANTDLLLALDGNVVEVYNSAAGRAYESLSSMEGDVLLRTRLPDPASRLEMVFSVASLPLGPGSITVMWIGIVLVLVLGVGFWWIYRLGVQQIDLAEQQQDFVSAVSHELKTPLTSIRMYGEMLKTGWADEAKRSTYYDHIYRESERLTRLINNLLSMARITRNKNADLHLEPKTIRELLATTDTLVVNTVTQADFELVIKHEAAVAETEVLADPDAFAQVLVNLIDNAIKFTNGTANVIELGTRQRGDFVEFWVRDYGPGIEPSQLKKIFRMFYRVENELTRETSGTGIGLALVSELVAKMHGEIDVVNCNPGAEFRVRLQVVQA